MIQCELLPSEIEGVVTDVSCSTGTGGGVDVTGLPFYGAEDPVYKYNWSNGATTEDVTGLPAGEYCVTITEINTGCVGSACFQVGSSGTGDFYVDFDMQAGCSPSNGGEITAVPSDPSLGPFEYVWTTYNWSIPGPEQIGTGQTLSNVPLGWYDVVVTDAMGCTVSDYALMWTPATPFAVAPVEDPVVVCPGQTGTAEIEVTHGVSSGPFTYSWVNYSQQPVATINTGQQSVLDNVAPGNWVVTVTNGEGCEAYAAFSVRKSPMGFESVIETTCNEGSIQLTPEPLKGSSPPYSYIWSDGETTEDRTGLGEGYYTVTITDALGCTTVESFHVEHIGTNLLLDAEIGDNGCGTSCNGTITLEVDPSVPIHYSNIQWADVSNFWKPDERHFLCPGDYHVTITSDDGCEEEHTFTVGQAGQEPFLYEVEVRRYFGNEIGPVPNGHALVKIISNQIQYPGIIEVSGAPDIDPVLVTANCSNSHAWISIPVQHKDVDPFHFKYVAPNECEYFGGFPGIDECLPDDGFGFFINHLGNSQQDCGPGQDNAYELDVYHIGDNFPYFIEVVMVNEDGSETFVKMLEITEFDMNSDNPISIDGIPSGTVKFYPYNLCYDVSSGPVHVNCCGDFSCDVIYEGSSSAYDGSYYWRFPYFRLWAKKSLDCFDECGDFNEGECSKVTIEYGSTTSDHNCWTGEITITYGNGSTGVLEVLENGEVDQIKWKSGNKEWEPNSPDSYTISINYLGNNGSTNCNTSIEVDYHGPGHYNDVIGFNDQLAFSGYPSAFYNAYSSVWRCGVCEHDIDYIMGNNQSLCDNWNSSTQTYDNWAQTYFLYDPESLSEPCTKGGELTVIDFDASGDAIIQTIEVPANPSIVLGEWKSPMQYIQPFGHDDENTYCSNFGFCLFEPNTGPNPIYDAYIDKPLLVSWFDENSCEPVDWNDPSSPDFNPCGSGNPCPGEMICYEGSCYQPCLDGECQSGNCEEVVIDGITVSICIDSDNDGCAPPCMEGYECFEGDCYPDPSQGEGEDICSFVETVNGSGSQTFYFYHDLPTGTTIIFDYNRYFQPDEFYINGSGINEHIQCGAGGPEQAVFITTEPPPNVITVTGVPCPEEGTSNYWIKLSCDNFQGNPPTTKMIVNPNNKGIFVRPNPFKSSIIIEATDMEEPFDGQVVLLDNMGREVLDKRFAFGKGNNNTSLEGLEDLPKGIYIVLIKKEGGVHASQKMVKIE